MTRYISEVSKGRRKLSIAGVIASNLLPQCSGFPGVINSGGKVVKGRIAPAHVLLSLLESFTLRDDDL
jgi:hypothetical protein